MDGLPTLSQPTGAFHAWANHGNPLIMGAREQVGDIGT